MLFKNLYKPIFLLVFFGLPIYTMEKNSKINSEHESIWKITEENINQLEEPPLLKQIAFNKVNNILQNELTLDDNPKWLLKNSLPQELEKIIKKELIKNNCTTWWYCFGNRATTTDISSHISDSDPQVKISPNDENLLMANDRKSESPDAVEVNDIDFKIYNLLNDEIIYRGFVKNNPNVNESGLTIEGYFIKENIIKNISHVDLKNYFWQKDLDISESTGYACSAPASWSNMPPAFFKFCSNDLFPNHYYIPITQDTTFNRTEYEKLFNKIDSTFLLNGSYTKRTSSADWSSLKFRIIQCKNKNVAITLYEDILKIWNLNTHECIISKTEIKNLKVSNDCNLLFCFVKDKIEVIDINTLKKIAEILDAQKILDMNTNNTILIISFNSQTYIWRLDKLLNSLMFCQLILIKLLYKKYIIEGYTKIHSNSVWNQILKSFDPDIQQLIFKKFNLIIACNN